MVPKRIGIASRSQSVSLHDIANIAAALNLQVQRDFQPIWNVAATVSAIPDPEFIEPGVWPIFIVDDVGSDGALGFHLTEHQQPYALVQSGRTWSLTASHELLEMIVDPSGNWLVPSTGITVSHGAVKDLPGAKFEYLVEVADPSEAPTNAYMIDDVLVSDFYTPHFFDHSASPGVRYSFSGNVKRPRDVLQGGYISWLNAKLGKMQQLKWLGAAPEIVDLPSHLDATPSRSLRGFVDQQTRLPIRLSQLDRTSQAVQRQRERVDYLQSASTLRSAAYTFARRPTGELAVLPPPDAAQRALNANKTRLQVNGATKAYVGWHFENGWITRKRAIVVLARRADVEAVRNLVPDSIGDIPVDVRVDPRPPHGGAAATGLLVAAETGAVREELVAPTFAGEQAFEEPGVSALAAARAAKPQVAYQPPAGASLQPITTDMTLTLHASPEQGWAQLREFLKGIEQELVVGVYEFTAPHIEKAILKELKSPEKLTLTLDSPPAKKSREQTVEETEQHLSARLERRLSFAWALSGQGHDAPARAFPTSYHIKVAVKDSKAMWLSSGNWNTSNQPDVDPDDETALAAAARTSDRDWHVICDCPKLAGIYRKYLLQDYKTAHAAVPAATTAAAAAAAAEPAIEPLETMAVAARTPKSFFPAHKLSGKIKVKPLLTPDDYRKPVLELIKSAKQRFFMQTQYIHTIDAAKDADAPFGGPKHMELITAVADLIRAGVDVRLIASEYQDHGWLEKLQDAGVDAVEHVRIQPRVHNKGIVVDSQIVVVSSQNWSADGTGPNRDAGLIIYNEEAAQYFEGIFLHDWVNMAATKVLR